jgi:hypothetical protein
MSSNFQELNSLAKSEAESDSKRAMKRRRDDEDLILQAYCTNFLCPCRAEKFLRTRWQEGYLRNLAEKEILSFVNTVLILLRSIFCQR